MALGTLFLLALGVSADAFAVAVGRGLVMKRLEVRELLALAATFGAFQAVMPLIGHSLGAVLLDRLAGWGPMIGAGLLAAVGLKMLFEAFSTPEDDERSRCLPWKALLLLGIATSIDALAVGVSLSVVSVDLLAAVALIGATTFLLTGVGVALGQRLGAWSRRPAEIAGSVVLLLLAVHLVADAHGA